MWESVDKKVAETVTMAMIIGIGAATVRAMAEKEKLKPFVVRLLSGAIMSGLIAYITKDMDWPSWMSGVIAFSCGWAAAEIGAAIAKMGRTKGIEMLGGKSEETAVDTKKENDNECKPVD